MSIRIIKQYSVFLMNEPGTLNNFSGLFAKESVDVVAISQDVRYDAAVVRVAVEDKEEISQAITKAGFTSVKTDVICVDMPQAKNAVMTISDVLGKEGINISTIYGAAVADGSCRFIVVVNDIVKAAQALEKSGKFE
ncbi:hypothetical protein Dip518_000290 [Parelusimicrobium proximum]|uniref:hypothetical protein n=1 Tax=Parelusimicrobium proximum TaxID=3228953 RepID=UPI003D17D109